ncbi:MAG: hemolysin [Bacteroidetes bacterium HGW-Bacteroidetes-1]|jgi:CBS domain containing-hemolysin-like protein|nr:MAG: hemolysin [Bacteroidetes bacterium HGW-Bacteroidetes-1]
MTDWQLIIITLLFSAFFSGMEIAFVSANRLRIELDLKKNSFTSRIVNGFYKNPSHFIGALLLGNNVALVVYGIVMARMLEPLVSQFLPSVILNDFSVLLTQTLLSTMLILLVAEFLPKIIFRINPNGILNTFSGPVWIIFYILYPLIIIYIGLAEFILKKIFRLHLDNDDYKFSAIDLNEYIKDYSPDDKSEDEVNHDIQLFQNAIDFRHIKLRECMVPRTEIEAISVEEDIDSLMKKFSETKHSKILVYKDSIDNIIGYVHSFDMFKHPENIGQVLRSIDVFPEAFAANRLLSNFIEARQGIAVVVDEFGGTSGIVSMEDIIEEIFGEIEDEYDEEETIEQELSDKEYIFSARLEIDYLNEAYRLNIPESEDYETLAGYILSAHESIPALGEEILIEPYRFKILKASRNKLVEVKLTLEE